MQKKQPYTGIDVMKFAAAFLVTAIHIPLFQDVDFLFSYYFTETLCRVAVPFFFACAGYFLAKKWEDGEAIKRYVWRLLQLYGIWTLLYLPQILYQYRQNGLGAGKILREFLYRFVVTGSYTQFWYFPALLIAVCVLYLLKGKCQIADRFLIPLICILYVFGVFGNSYYGFLIGKDSWAAAIYENFFAVFETTRNGIFFGLFYVYMGTLVRKRLSQRRLGGKARLALGSGLVLGLLAMFGERFWLLQHTQYTMSDMTFAMAPVVCMLLLLGINLHFSENWQKRGMALRCYSTIIFCSHLLTEFYLHKGLLMLGAGEVLGFSVFRFGYAFIGALTLAMLIWRLSEKRGIRWLKRLY